MRTRTAFAIISAMTVSAIAGAQSALPPALHVGDNAPAIPITGVIKGDRIDHVEKGKTYVVEFWATWCGPCIASMPHLSEMADKYQGKVSFVSVNTWDYNKDAKRVPETEETHVKRVADWVTKNTDKMRYNIVRDDVSDTISTTWMFAAGRYGIPCAFIVNDEGRIAWIGHPTQMAEPLEAVSNKTWDLKAFADKFNPSIDAERANREVQLKVAAAVKANDNPVLYKIIDSADTANKSKYAMMAISSTSRTNPDLAFAIFKKYAHMAPASEAVNWCQTASGLARSLKTDEAKNELAAMCGECTSMADPKSAALAYTYHASVLNSVGKKEEAAKWIEKAKAAVSTYEPANQHDGLLKFIESTAKSFEKS